MACSSNATSEKEESAAEAGGWWDSWITSAKSKSAEVYTMVKKDLDEISSAVKSEASHVYTTTSSVIGKTLKLDEPESTANTMKKSLSSFIGQVSTVLNPEPDDSDTEVIHSSGDTTMFSTYKKELEALQRVDATFLVSVESPEYEAWRASLEGPDCGVIAPSAAVRRLEANPVLKEQYGKLVPDAVGHDEFWERYLFRVALLQDRLAAAARRQAAPATAPLPEKVSTDPVMANLPLQSELPITRSPEKVASPAEEATLSPDESDEGVAWEDEDFASDVELTEEQQTLLLQEYEREITTKKQYKNGSPRETTDNNSAKTKTNKTVTPDDTTKPIDSKNKAVQTKKKAMDNETKVGDGKAKSIDKTKADSKKTTVKSRTAVQKKTDVKNKSERVAVSDADVCGKNLVEDYFDNKEVKKTKDDASSNSDESWEKEFEIEDASPA